MHRLLEPLDALGQRLQRRPGITATQQHQRDLEREARVGRVGPAHVDDGLAERFDGAHQHRVAERNTDVLQRVAVLGGGIHPGTARRSREQERVARGTEQVLGDTARLVPAFQELLERDERGRRILIRDRPDHSDPRDERGTGEQRRNLLEAEGTDALGDRLVEQRHGVAHGPRARARYHRQRLRLDLDALALRDVREVRGDLLRRDERELVVLGP